MAEKITFKDAVQKFIHIGEIYFRGHYHDNVHNIFNELSEEERKVILRTIYHVYVLEQNGIPDNPSDLVHRAPLAGVTDEPAPSMSITANGTFVVSILLVFIFVLLMLFVILGADSGEGSSFQNFLKLLAFLI